MENTVQDRLSNQQEMLRDLQSQLAASTDENEKKSLQLKMNVVSSKIKELQNEQSSESVKEETEEEVEIETPEEQLDEAYSHKEEIKKLSDHIKTLKGSVDKIEQACKKENWFDIIDKIEDTESLIDMLKFHYNNVYNASKNKTLTESVYEVSKDDIRWDDKIVLKTAKFYGIAVAPDYDHTNHFLFAGNQKDLYRFINEILRHSPVRGQNFKVLKESLPSNYSKSKYLKEVSEATKAIRDICTRIDNSAKRGDLYNIAGDFGAISAFTKRCEEGSKEIYGYEKKGTLTESVESKKDFLKHLDDYEKDIKKAIDSIRKNIKDSKKTSGMDGDYLVSMSSAISNALTRYNHSVDTKTLTEAIVQDKARWDDAVKFGKSHGHPAPKLSLGQKTSKGEVVGVMYGRLSATPIYSVSKDGGRTFKDYYEEE